MVLSIVMDLGVFLQACLQAEDGGGAMFPLLAWGGAGGHEYVQTLLKLRDGVEGVMRAEWLGRLVLQGVHTGLSV